jgi:hypothetical protein
MSSSWNNLSYGQIYGKVIYRPVSPSILRRHSTFPFLIFSWSKNCEKFVFFPKPFTGDYSITKHILLYFEGRRNSHVKKRSFVLTFYRRRWKNVVLSWAGNTWCVRSFPSRPHTGTWQCGTNRSVNEMCWFVQGNFLRVRFLYRHLPVKLIPCLELTKFDGLWGGGVCFSSEGSTKIEGNERLKFITYFRMIQIVRYITVNWHVIPN